MRGTIDGFPIQRFDNWFAEEIDPKANLWSFGKTIKIEIMYDDYYLNLRDGKFARTVTWKGKSIRVIDYDWFLMMIRGWVEDKFFPMTKEQAFDLFFEMDEYIPKS